jgi:membrane fusion protein (multidrug efflux system)
MQKTLFGSVILVLVVLAVGAGIGYLKYRSIAAQMNAPPRPEMPESVVLRSVTPITARQSVTSIGTVLAPRSVDLKTEVVGTISSIDIRNGEIVEPGAVLVQLDTSVEQAQLQGAQAMMQIAESTFQRSQKAAAANAISELELEQSAAMLAQTRAEIARLEAIIRKKTLSAPFRAKVGLSDLHVGQYLAEGTRITMLQGVDDFVHIDFAMPQRVADEVAVHDKVTLLGGVEPLSAEIVAIDSQADRMTRSIIARARLQNPPETLQPNDSVKVFLEYGPEIQAVAIPLVALRRTPAGSIVYVAEADEQGMLRARVVDVVAGMTRGNEIVILKGLNVDQSVVADGSFKVHEGCLLVNKDAMEKADLPQDSEMSKVHP